MNPDWIVPNWPAPTHVGAVCTTRAGGASSGPYASLNLGDHVGDDAEAVLANRHTLQQALAARPVFLKQVHGTSVAALSKQTFDATVADGCMTTQPGVACTIMVADCLPVLLTDLEGTAVAAAHAGWRGLAGAGSDSGNGVLEQTFERFRAVALEPRSMTATKIIAWLGPCIGAEAFEVGPEVRAAFVAHDPQAATLFKPLDQNNRPGKWLADLQGLARQRLQALGITQIYGNDGSREWCTVSNPSRFFSHRRDAVVLGGSGRLAACIWLD